MSYHAKLSPSSAERWLVCPGSVPLTESIPEPPSSPHAAEGTLAHDVSAKILLGSLSNADKWNIEPEMMDYASGYADEVRRRAAGNILLVEQRVSSALVTGTVDNDGTADAVILDMENKFIEVIDLKYGKGVIKHAEDNPQLMLYGLGVLCTFDHILEAERFKLTIYQPRRDHISEVELTREELLAFGETVKKGVHEVEGARICQATGSDADFQKQYLRPDPDACRWCKAKATCPALNTTITETVFDATGDFEVLDEPTTVKPEQMPTLPSPSRLELVEQWVHSVRDFIFEKLKGGEEVPGWKVVRTKKGARRWQDADAAEEQVRALKIKVGDAFDRKLKSPTQLQKVVSKKKWEQLEAHVTQSEPGVTLVDENDSREAVVFDATGDFESLQGEQL